MVGGGLSGIWLFAAWMAAGLLLLAVPARAQDALRGVALVIGNGDYAALYDLANPARDADAVEALFADLGFDSVRRTDRDAVALARDLERFVEDAAGADVAVLYYAGHGIEAGGENFLVPVDADLAALDDAGTRLVPLSSFLARLEAAVPLAIVLLDACRDNPFPAWSTLRTGAADRPLPVASAGLSGRSAAPLAAAVPAAAPSFGTMLGFAAQPGAVALDGEPGANSPYAAALLRHLDAMDGAEFGTVMRMVGEEVYLRTAGRQRPWVNESLRRLLYFGAAPQPLAADEGAILSERRQLLLTVAELPDLDRGRVERVALEGGVPIDTVYGMLRALGSEISEDPAQLEAQLRAETQRFARLLAEREVVTSPDPEIVRLTGLADAAEREGLLVTATALRERATARFRELEPTLEAQQAALDARFIEGAAVFARSGDTRNLSGDHLGAAKDYAEAFRLVEGRDRALAWLYRQGGAESLATEGVYRSDFASLDLGLEEARKAFAIAVELHDAEKIAASHLLLGHIHSAFGLSGDVARYEDALEAFDEAGRIFTREAFPERWAEVQSGIGLIMDDLAGDVADTGYLADVMLGLSVALEDHARDPTVISWRAVRDRLAAAIDLVGDIEPRIAQRMASVDAFRKALAGTNRSEDPRRWAGAHRYIGNGLYALAEWQDALTSLRAGLATYRGMASQPQSPGWSEATARLEDGARGLENATEALWEVSWAAAALAGTLRHCREEPAEGCVELGDDVSEAATAFDRARRVRLSEAVRSFRLALGYLAGVPWPDDYAQISKRVADALDAVGALDALTPAMERNTAELAAALELLADSRQDPAASAEALLEAVEGTADALSASLDRPKWDLEGFGFALDSYVTLITPDLEAAETVVASSPGVLDAEGTARQRREAAAASFRSAMDVLTLEAFPVAWAELQHQLGSVLAPLAIDDPRYLADAVAAYEAAIDTYQHRGLASEAARSRQALGGLLLARGAHEDGTATLERSVELNRAALLLLGSDTLESVEPLANLGDALVALGERTGDGARLREGRASIQAALAISARTGGLPVDPRRRARIAEADGLIASLP